MTENGAFKKQVRALMRRDGIKYTEARRRVLAEREAEQDAVEEIEPHYAFEPPRSIVFVDRGGRRPLELSRGAGSAFGWGYGGSGPLTSAKAVLADATGPVDQRLAVAFVTDNLSWWSELGNRSFVLTVAEGAGLAQGERGEGASGG